MIPGNDLQVKVPAQSGITHVEGVLDPVFIADLHLTGKKPRTLLAFLWFLRTQAKKYRELFILGDFFEYWIGDDASEPAQPVIKALRRYTQSGRRLYLMQGNRDFLLGDGFAKACGGTLLSEKCILTIGQTRILLAHGDQWCTLDEEYQAFRRLVRDPQWQINALKMSVSERIDYAKNLRGKSNAGKKVKTVQQMDVVVEAVTADAIANSCEFIIHGHTHRPASHMSEPFPRFVIPDWELDAAPVPRKGWVEINSCSLPQVVIG